MGSKSEICISARENWFGSSLKEKVKVKVGLGNRKCSTPAVIFLLPAFSQVVQGAAYSDEGITVKTKRGAKMSQKFKSAHAFRFNYILDGIWVKVPNIPFSRTP